MPPISTLFNKSLGDIPFEGEVFCVSTEDSINYVKDTLGKKGFLSAPIKDAQTGKYLGFFDVTDSLAMVFTVDSLATIVPEGWIEESAKDRLAKPNKEAEIKVKDFIMDGDNSIVPLHQFIPLTTKDTLKDALLLLKEGKEKRIPIVDDSGKLVKLLTPSQITKIIDQYIKDAEKEFGEDYLQKLNPIFSKTVSQLPGLKKAEEIISVQATEPVREAFLKILTENVGAVAVVDEDGMLLSSVSNSDVRMFSRLETIIADRLDEKEKDEEPHGLMDTSAEDFVKLVTEQFHEHKTTKIPHVSVSLDCTFARVISKLAFTRKHRVWVTDAMKSVVTVVSVSDVAKILLTADS